jgi:outer membrane protein TolC
MPAYRPPLALPTAAALLGLFALAAVPPPARAQAAPPGPAGARAPGAAPGGALTLERAIALALAQSETPPIAAARLERAQALRRQAVAALLPSLGLTGAYTRRARAVTRQISGDTVTVQAIDALNGQAVVESTLFDLRALPLLGAATAGVEAQARESRELERALAFDVAHGFLDALSAERLHAAAAERLRVAEATLEQTRIRGEAGLADRNDVTRTELEAATARVVVTQAANLVATTRLALGYLLGEPLGERALAAPDEPAAAPEAPERLLGRAGERRLDLAALAERARERRQLALVPRYGFAPRLDLRGIYRKTNEAGLSGREEDWNVAVNFTWELYDGGDRDALAAQRDAEAREAELALARARREVELEVRTALADLASAEAAVAQAEVRLAVARANAEEVHERFAHGLATALEEADALASRFEADAGAVRQRYLAAAARIDLRRAVGDWPLPAAAPPAPAAPAPAPEVSR